MLATNEPHTEDITFDAFIPGSETEGSTSDSDDAQYLCEDARLFQPKGISGVHCEYGIWMFRVDFAEEIVSTDLFNQFGVGDQSAWDLAERMILEDNAFQVVWKSQWLDYIPEGVSLDCDSFFTILSVDDKFLWRKEWAAVVINDKHRLHFCFDCEPCADLGKARRAAVQYAGLFLAGCEAVELDSETGVAERLVDLAQSDNPLRRYFMAAGARSENVDRNSPALDVEKTTVYGNTNLLQG